MTYHDDVRTRTGPFGYTLDDLASRAPEEREAMRGELEELENNLQWGYEPGRWADGADYYRGAWPDAKLLGADAFASSFDQRDDLQVEAENFGTMLGQANKVWKAQAGRNSPSPEARPPGPWAPRRKS